MCIYKYINHKTSLVLRNRNFTGLKLTDDKENTSLFHLTMMMMHSIFHQSFPAKCSEEIRSRVNRYQVVVAKVNR